MWQAALAAISDGVDADAPVPDDPVAVYDVMREAANRLAAVYAQQVTVGGIDASNRSTGTPMLDGYSVASFNYVAVAGRDSDTYSLSVAILYPWRHLLR